MMKIKAVVLVAVGLIGMFQGTASAAPASVPLYKVTVVQNSTPAINYRYLKSSTMIDFKGTVLLAEAKGTARIKSKAGATEIDAEFENLPSATQFGPAYFTYVLWAISPEGRPNNLGELIVKNGKSELQVTEKLQAFGLIVTAEPYFAVSGPSNVVVMENAIRKNTKGTIEVIDAKFELLQRGQYEVNIAPSELGMVMDKDTPLAVYEARNAIRIARATGAETYAPDAFRNAQLLLVQVETKGMNKKEQISMAREAVQRAEDARLISLKRQEVESLANERQNFNSQIGVAKNSAATAALEQAKAEAGQAKAELAQGKAELAQGKSDAGRTAAEAAAVTANEATGQANAGRAAAEVAAASSEQARHQAANERNIAVGVAQRVEGEKSLLRTQLLAQLNSVLQTRDSARGLIVNMSGVLFETGKSDLRPAAREKLSKISGIVLGHPGLKLEVEGHTDSVGSDASNQVLSERRAQGARDYLVSQGVPADSIVSRGFGSTKPSGSNETVEGRQTNRRVELIVSGDAIRIPVKAAR